MRIDTSNVYFTRLHEKYGLPVYPIVLFSYDAPRKAAAFRYTVPEEERKAMVLTTTWEQKGIVEGRQQGEALIVSRQLERRFGTLTPELQQRVNALKREQLETLALELLDFTGIGQVQNWLDAHA